MSARQACVSSGASSASAVSTASRSMPFSASLRRISRGERFCSARYFALCRAKFSSFIKPSRCISATAAAAERASNFRHSLSYSSPDAWSRKERYPRALSLALRVSLCSFRASKDAASSAAPSLTWFFTMVSPSMENRKSPFSSNKEKRPCFVFAMRLIVTRRLPP